MATRMTTKSLRHSERLSLHSLHYTSPLSGFLFLSTEILIAAECQLKFAAMKERLSPALSRLLSLVLTFL